MALYLLTERPDYGAKIGTTPTVATAQYGDGYRQDTPVGINNASDVLTVQFTRKAAAAVALYRLLKSFAGAQRFMYQPLWLDAPAKFITTGEINLTSQNWDQHVVSATFQQVFDPD